jgi:hypothetical protein
VIWLPLPRRCNVEFQERRSVMTRFFLDFHRWLLLVGNER